MQRIMNPPLHRHPLKEQQSRLKELRDRSPAFRSRARLIEAGRFVTYFLFLFFVASRLIDRLQWFWAVILITAIFAVIDWLCRRLLMLHAADKEIQRLAELQRLL